LFMYLKRGTHAQVGYKKRGRPRAPSLQVVSGLG
jgi:hypothetical protein